MKSSTLVAAALGAGGTVTLCWLIYRRVQSKRLQWIGDSEKWQRLGTLKEINIYPLKSGAALQLAEVYCGDNGLSWQGLRDRQLLLVDDEDKMAYAGVYPYILSIKPELLRNGVLRLSAPNLEPLTLDLNALAAAGTPVTDGRLKKRYPFPLVECKPEHHAWCSQAALKRPSGLRLYIALDKKVKPCLSGTQNEFKPVMILHDKSVRDLNTRLSTDNQVHPQQFRSNLIIESLPEVPPYHEDQWLWLKICDDMGRVRTLLRFNSECLRCILVNVNVETCARNADFEPLRTLKKYRLRDHPLEPAMGVYFDILGGTRYLKTGDQVYVQ